MCEPGPGYECQCDSGYSLDSDNMSCVANAECSGEGDNLVCQCLDGFRDESNGNSNIQNCIGRSALACFCVILLSNVQILMNVLKDWTLTVVYMLTVLTQLVVMDVSAVMAMLGMEQIAVSLLLTTGKYTWFGEFVLCKYFYEHFCNTFSPSVIPLCNLL